MNKLLLSVPIALLIAAPAGATTGLICNTAGPRPVQLALAISHTAVPAVVSVLLTDNRREVAAVTAQSWFDANEVRVDLVDRKALRHEARLSAKRNGASYDGTIWRDGQRRWIRCREG